MLHAASCVTAPVSKAQHSQNVSYELLVQLTVKHGRSATQKVKCLVLWLLPRSGHPS
jgi:hypothetical protein